MSCLATMGVSGLAMDLSGLDALCAVRDITLKIFFLVCVLLGVTGS